MRCSCGCDPSGNWHPLQVGIAKPPWDTKDDAGGRAGPYPDVIRGALRGGDRREGARWPVTKRRWAVFRSFH